MTIAAIIRTLRSAFWQALKNDALDLSKAAAYSGMLMLFPAFLVLTTMLALVPAGYTLLDEIRTAAEQFLPADTMSLLQSFFFSRRTFSLQLLLSGATLSLFAGWGLMSTFMNGFRRAYHLPRVRKKNGKRPKGEWSFWQIRLRSLLLVPIALVPLSVSSLLIVFGRPIEQWMLFNTELELRAVFLLLWRLLRWSLALLTSATVLGALYYFGTNIREHWSRVIPGAVTATLLWFPVTLAFGVYVTRVADYSIIYGSLGTAIATLVWLYLTSFSVLLGAQINGVLYRERRKAASLAKAEARVKAVAAAPSPSQAVPPGPGANGAAPDRAAPPVLADKPTETLQS